MSVADVGFHKNVCQHEKIGVCVLRGCDLPPLDPSLGVVHFTQVSCVYRIDTIEIDTALVANNFPIE